MPTINQSNDITITVERFLNACSPEELFDVDRLIGQARYQNKIGALMGDIRTELAVEEVLPRIEQIYPGLAPTYYCKFCKEVPVDADNGFDTCDKCLAKQ